MKEAASLCTSRLVSRSPAHDCHHFLATGKEVWRSGRVTWQGTNGMVSYYEYHHSRGSEVVKAVLGESFEGVLGSDFYASYNVYMGLHQRMPGCICYATATSSKNSTPITLTSNSGLRTLKRSMTGPSPTPGLIRACLRPSKRPLDESSNVPSSRSCGSSVRPTRTRLLPCIPYVSASNASCPSCLSLWRSLACRLRTISPSAACDRWSLRARSVGVRGVQRAVRPAWASSVSLAPGPRRRHNPFLQCLTVLSQNQSLLQM